MDLDTVGEGPETVSLRILRFTDNAAGSLRPVQIHLRVAQEGGLERGLGRSGHHRAEVGFRDGNVRIFHIVVAVGIDGLRFGDHLRGIGGHLFRGNGEEDAPLQGVLVHRVEQRIVAQEVLDADLHQVARADLLRVALAVQVVALADVQPRHLELFGGDAVLQQAVDFAQRHFGRARELRTLTRRDGAEQQVEIRRTRARYGHGRLGGTALLPGGFAEAVGEHGGYDLAGKEVADILLTVTGIRIREAVLVDEFHRLVADLRIGLVRVHRFGLCRRDAGILGGGIHRRGNVGKPGAHAGFHLVEIDVTHDGDSLQVRPVPFMIEVQDLLALETVDHLQRADHGTVRMLRPLVDEVRLAAHHPVAGFVAEAPLLADHAAFRIEVGLLAGDVARPVVQDQQY